MKLAWDSSSRVDRSDGKYHREKSDPRYHTARWARLSRTFRDSHPLCARCQAQGIIRPAQCVDHIIPVPICQDFYDIHNLQSLCNECNMLKGNEDKKKIQQWKQDHSQI